MTQHEYWQSCSVNCGSHCALRFFADDGILHHVETDNVRRPTTADDMQSRNPQLRACVKGRAIRYWLNSANRLNFPMKRIGRRGEGKFERISWDEAINTIACEMRRIVQTYGNEALYLTYGTGLFPESGSSFERLANSYGGHLGRYGDYSCAQLQEAIRYTYGDNGYYSASTLGEACNASLVLLFGSNPAATRMGGGSAMWEFRQTCEQAKQPKVICIDPRYTETMSGGDTEWIPIRPGTDAALVAGLAYELIANNLVDQHFLDTYCIGYNRVTMPFGAPANASYCDYILGTGPDGTAKTPSWASRITGIPQERITSLAHEIASASPLYVAQGWGPQRHHNGELTARAIPMLAILTGNVGLPGTNTGVRERFLPFVIPTGPVGKNPVKTKIPVYMWSRAVERGTELTARNGGVRGAEKLSTPVKMIINHAGNCLTNQHADINRTHDILVNESLCEFIVVCDVMMTDSARYADILLPDVARVEQANSVSTGSADIVRGIIRGGNWNPGRYERRPATEIARDIADKLGVAHIFDAIGQDCDCSHAEGAAIDESHAAPGTGAPKAQSEVKVVCADHGSLECEPYTGPTVGLQDFRDDPIRNPLPTPSGKIEIYSQELSRLAKTLEYGSDQVVDPLPIYAEEPEGAASPLRANYPFQLVGYHASGHVHSSYANVEELQALFPHELWVNPIDAHRLHLKSGDTVRVESSRGAIITYVRVTTRIIPGAVALPQGAWHKADMFGDRTDWGGCINTLTSDEPTPLARGNAQGTVLVRICPIDDMQSFAVSDTAAQGKRSDYDEQH